MPLCFLNTLNVCETKDRVRKKHLISRLRRRERKQGTAGFMAVAGHLSAHTANDIWRQLRVTRQLLDLAAVDFQRKKIKELLNASFPSEVNPEKEGEPERKMSHLSHCNLSMTRGQGRFFTGKLLGPQITACMPLQHLTINLETHPAGDSPWGKCVEDALVASFILQGDSVNGDGRCS